MSFLDLSDGRSEAKFLVRDLFRLNGTVAGLAVNESDCFTSFENVSSLSFHCYASDVKVLMTVNICMKEHNRKLKGKIHHEIHKSMNLGLNRPFKSTRQLTQSEY